MEVTDPVGTLQQAISGKVGEVSPGRAWSLRDWGEDHLLFTPVLLTTFTPLDIDPVRLMEECRVGVTQPLLTRLVQRDFPLFDFGSQARFVAEKNIVDWSRAVLAIPRADESALAAIAGTVLFDSRTEYYARVRIYTVVVPDTVAGFVCGSAGEQLPVATVHVLAPSSREAFTYLSPRSPPNLPRLALAAPESAVVEAAAAAFAHRHTPDIDTIRSALRDEEQPR